MKNRIIIAAVRTKNHVRRNKVAYAASAVAIAAIALQQSNTKAFYEFLESEGIDPMKYYCQEAYEELNQ